MVKNNGHCAVSLNDSLGVHLVENSKPGAFNAINVDHQSL